MLLSRLAQVHLLVVVLYYSVTMLFSCVHPCKSGYNTKPGLVRHQNNCPIFRTAQALKIEQRRATHTHKAQAQMHGLALPGGGLTSLHARKGRMGSTSGSVLQSPANNFDDSSLSGTPILPIPVPTEISARPQDFHSILSASLPSVTYSPAGRHQRNTKIPRRFQDILPVGPTPIPVLPNQPRRILRVILHVRDFFRSTQNVFGILREYLHRPSYDPDAYIQSEDLANFPTVSAELPPVVGDVPTTHPPPWPFDNMSKYLLMNWLYTGSTQKSESEITRLAKEVIGNTEFKPEDLAGFSAHRENRRLDDSGARTTTTPFSDDDWKEVSVEIEVPDPKKGALPQKFKVPGLHHRSIVQVIKATWGAATSKYLHLTPFKRIHVNQNGVETRIYDEVYTSEAFEIAHDRLQKQPSEAGCTLEKVIAGLMFWSDSTHLTNFGTAKVWPLYMYFANLSKYTRAKPNSGACHHIAYIPSIPDNFKDFIWTFIHTAAQRKAMLTHCRRELMHAVWRLMLDEEFLQAYQHGIVLKCADGVIRRVYPRIFTYAADYPEKALLATIRERGACPCPRCLVTTEKLDKLGQKPDMNSRVSQARTFLTEVITTARNAFYYRGIPITSSRVSPLLEALSLVPTMNAFAEKLGPFGFDPYPMFVVDLLHEFELGVWKTTFKHIIRVLFAAVPGGGAVAKLDARFRQIPTFGTDTIRRFSNNASEMKKIAARDYEDLLQNMIPVVEHLLPDKHNAELLTLLYRLAEWHALAKLRMHTETTLNHLEKATVTIGQELRSFRDITSAAYTCKELPGETSKRTRRRRKKGRSKGTFEQPTSTSTSTSQGTSATPSTTSNPPPDSPSAAPGIETLIPELPAKTKNLNLFTYKLHALGDYVRTIRLFGTTDSYSTQIGELAHRLVKRFYGRTNKNRAIRQIAKHERRTTRLRRAREAAAAPHNKQHIHQVAFSENDPLSNTGSDLHHHMSDSKNYPQHLHAFVQDDPAKIRFIPKLKNHLLARLLNRVYDGDDMEFSDDQRNSVRIVGDRIYSSKVLRVNYTTYDMRRGQDTLNPRTHCDVMVISPETGNKVHPFWYARVLGVFHANVLHISPDATNRSIQHMEFLWVRWFGIEPNYRYGTRFARLPKIGFIPDTDISAFGFLDPSLVLRGCHLVPAFADGRTTELFKTSLPTAARLPKEVDDWTNYYVIIWVDRDMFMRYLGDGIGHLNQHARWKVKEDEAMDVDSENEEPEINHMAGISNEQSHTETHHGGGEDDQKDPNTNLNESDSDMGSSDSGDEDEDEDESSSSDEDRDESSSGDENSMGLADGEGDYEDDDGYGSF